MLMRKNWLSAGVNSLILLTTAILAHHVAGGMFISGHQFVSLLIPSFIALTVINRKGSKGPGLALVIIATQTFVHSVFGNMTSSNMTMFLSHIVFGFISYGYLRYANKFWRASTFLLGKLFKEYRNIHFSLPVLRFRPTTYHPNFFQTLNFQAISRRGPPLLVILN
jgi:hypothetical protein